MSETKETKEMKEDTCVNCAYFDQFPIQKKEGNVIGACKANPPIPAGDYTDSKLGIWPTVLGTFWCGIFTRKENFKR